MKYNSLFIFISIILSIFLLNLFLSNIKLEDNFEELALGKKNKTVWANIDNKRIHCGDLNNLDLCLKSYKDSENKLPVVLWFGNSQLHAINQFKTGNETATAHLHRKLKKYNLYNLTLSQANASLQEHYLLLSYLIDKIPIKTLILPIFFDDLREDNLRPGIKTILNDINLKSKISKTFTGKQLLSRFSNKDMAGNEKKLVDEDIKDNFENLLNKGLIKIWPLWGDREILRGILFGKLYQIRNSIFGINASTTRRMIPARYEKNISAYKDILNLSIDNNIEVLVYIPPIRNDIKIPYNIEKYSKFKKEIKKIAKEKNFHFFNLENLVPPEFWGQKTSTNLNKKLEVDFMHFQSRGHLLLANAIFFEISNFFKLNK